jgi:arylsulfatase A-like enzyme
LTREAAAAIIAATNDRRDAARRRSRFNYQQDYRIMNNRPNQPGWLCWVIFSIVAVPSLLSDRQGRAAAADKPNIVLILVDDMGMGDPACFNPASKISTPHIDSLATAGTRFSDAHAAGPLCHMSRYGLMTGRYPIRTDVSLWPTQPLIEAGQVTVASLLRRNGYRTAMVGKWHLGFAEQGYDKRLPGGPTDVGFDSYFGIRASTDIPPYFYIRGDSAVAPPTLPIAANNSPGWSPIQGAFWRAGLIAPEMQLSDVLPRFTDEAIEVIADHADRVANRSESEPLFLYLAYPAPHTPWLPSPEFAGSSRVGMYGDFVEMTDAMIGRVLDALDTAGMRDNTLVIFSSDNGPTWYDVDAERFGHDSAGIYRGMKADAFEAGHRVPLIVRWPGNVAAGATNDGLIGFTDLLATFAALVGDPLPEADRLDSVNQLPLLTGQQDDGDRQTLIVAAGNGMETVRDGRWKLINGLGSGGFSKPSRIKPGVGDPQGQLYDLASDPGETTNLYLEKPQVVERLLSILRTERAKP